MVPVREITESIEYLFTCVRPPLYLQALLEALS